MPAWRMTFGSSSDRTAISCKECKIRNRTEWMVQALKSGLNHPPKDVEAEIAAIKETMEAKRKPKEEDRFHCYGGSYKYRAF